MASCNSCDKYTKDFNNGLSSITRNYCYHESVTNMGLGRRINVKELKNASSWCPKKKDC